MAKLADLLQSADEEDQALAQKMLEQKAYELSAVPMTGGAEPIPMGGNAFEQAAWRTQLYGRGDTAAVPRGTGYFQNTTQPALAPAAAPQEAPAAFRQPMPTNEAQSGVIGAPAAPSPAPAERIAVGSPQPAAAAGVRVLDSMQQKDGSVFQLVEVETPRGLVRETRTVWPEGRGQFAATDQKYQAGQASIAKDQAQTAKLKQEMEQGRATPVPSGYRKTTTGNLEAIPGGPADQKIAGQYNSDIATMQSSNADLDRLATSANELLNHAGLGRITGIPGVLPNIPGMAGADAQAKLATLKSQVGFGVLQAMRNASKTGGALGNVSDAEGKRLEANLAALDKSQSEDQMRESLQKIIDFSAGAKDRLANAFNLKHNPANPSTPAPSVGQPATAAAPAANKMQTIFEAQKAVAKGANRDAVRARLASMGITDAGI